MTRALRDQARAHARHDARRARAVLRGLPSPNELLYARFEAWKHQVLRSARERSLLEWHGLAANACRSNGRSIARPLPSSGELVA